MNNPELQERINLEDHRVSVLFGAAEVAEKALMEKVEAPMYQPEYKEPDPIVENPLVSSENIANFAEHKRRKLESESQSKLDSIFTSPSYQPPTLPVDEGYRDAA
jgi:hypothetical protein